MAKKKQKQEPKPEEKHFTVPLQSVFRNPRPKRARRAIVFIKKFVFKHLRVSAENVYISQALNEAIWAKGREHIPRKIKIKIVKVKEKANVYLESEKVKKAKEEKKAEKKEKKEETKAEKEEKEEIEKKKKEKKAKEKAAEAAAIKRHKGKEKQ